MSNAMKRHKLLWAVATAGILTVVAGAIVVLALFGPSNPIATKASAALAAVRQWLHGAATRVTTTQLVEAAALAWLVFLLALILLARSKPSKPPAPHVEVSGANTIPNVTQRHQAQMTEAMPREIAPPLPIRSMPGNEPADYQESARRARRTHSTSSLAEATAASNLAPEQRIELGEQIAHTALKSAGCAVDQSRGHVVALTGVSLARERALRYGLFIVAEDAGIAGTNGNASRRVIAGIAEEIIPSLARAPTLGSEQCATLLKLAVIQAMIDLRQQSIRTATHLEAVVAGVLVVGSVAHVVNIGDCRTYVFRPGGGLLPITPDHLAASYMMENELLEAEPFDTHALRDQIYPHREYNQTAGDVDTLEVTAYPGDLLLLGSSGLSEALPEPQIEAILRAAPDSRSAADLLACERTRQTGEHDFNVIVVRPLGDGMAEFGIATSTARAR
jgi:serine/threonine protein phosphatase PrpC